MLKNLGFVYETDRVEKIVLGEDITFTPPEDPYVAKLGLDTQSLDNCADTTASLTLYYSLSIHDEVETTTLSTELDDDKEYTLVFPESAKFFASVVDPESGTLKEVVIGKSLYESNLKYKTPTPKILSSAKDVSLEGNQGAVFDTGVHYSFVYDYHWTASATVVFADGRHVPLTTLSGRVYGSRYLSGNGAELVGLVDNPDSCA